MRDNLPYQKYIDAGWFIVAEKLWSDKEGNGRVYTKTLITPKGIAEIQKKL